MSVTDTVRERVILTERVRVTDVVGLIERVNGWVVGIGEGLSVPVTDRVRLTVTVGLIDLVNGHVVGIGEGLLVREVDRVRV